MPLQLLGTIASSQYIPSNVYFLNMTGDGVDVLVASGAKPNSSGDVYVASYNNTIPSSQLMKYDKDGVIQWQKNYASGSAGSMYSTGVVVDSADNPYFASRAQNINNAGIVGVHLAKYNSSATSQWQRVFYGSTVSLNPQGFGIDSSDNLYIASIHNPSTYRTQIFKVNSSGTLQWQRELTFGSGIILYSVSIDTSGNVYGTGEYGANSAIVKYNSSGTLQWQKEISGSSCLVYKTACSSSSAYAVGWATVSGTVAGLICKFDSSGNTVWTRTLNGTGDQYGYSIALDPSENVYVSGDNGTNGIFIAKYNSSGTIQWQRSISASSGSISVSANGLFATDNTIYVGMSTTAPGIRRLLTAVIPTDGSKTGTYSVGGSSFTYATSSLTDAAITLTNASGAATSSTSSYTDGSVNYAIGNTSYTSNTTIL